MKDEIGAEKQLEKYSPNDSTLPNSAEYKFLKNIITAVKEGNTEQF